MSLPSSLRLDCGLQGVAGGRGKENAGFDSDDLGLRDTIPSFLDRLPVPRRLYFYGKKHRDSYQFVEITFDNALICLYGTE